MAAATALAATVDLTAPATKLPRRKKSLTPFAKRFGVGDAEFHKGYKSGITPLTPLFSLSNPLPSKSKYRRRIQLERWQRAVLEGFTSRELKALGALPIFEEAQPSNLENSLHPLFRFRTWETQQNMPRNLPMVPLGHDEPGFYEANNDMVWAKMLPCLRLASKFLSAAHLSPWWDALVFGHLNIFATDLANNRMLARFSRRAPDIVFQNRQKVQDKLVALAGHVRLQFRDGHRDVHTGLFDDIYFSGCTTSLGRFFPFIRITLDTRLVEKMLFTRSTEAQTLAMQLELAQTLVHETAHALWRFISRSTELSNISWEPYYEGEGARELGYSMEQSIFGKTFDPFRGRSDFGFATRNFPGEKETEDEELGPFVGFKSDLAAADHFALPVQWINDVQLTDFWKFHVTTYGSFRVGPFSYGVRSVGLELFIDVFEGRESVFSQRVQDLPIQDNDSISANMRSIEIENSRRRRAKMAAVAFRATRESTEILARAMVTGEMKAAVGLIDDPDENIQDAADEILADMDIEEMTRTMGKVYTLDKQGMGRGLERAFLTALIDESDSDNDDIDESMADYGPMTEPPCFQRIRDLFLKHQVQLRIDTMVGMFPANTILFYLNRIIDPPLITPEDFDSFLKYCDAGPVPQFFGTVEEGSVCHINEGWRTLDPSDLPATPVYHEALDPELVSSMRAWCHDIDIEMGRQFRDWDVDIVWKAFARYRKDGFLGADGERSVMLQLVDEHLGDIWRRTYFPCSRYL